MASRTARSWSWIPADIAIVVIGILIAFGLNSFGERRSAAATEQAHLQGLRDDFAENVLRLEQLAQLSERTSAASRALLLIARGQQVASTDSVDGLISYVFSSDRFNAVMGAYEALVNSGGLTRIRDDTLRVALATFASMLDSRYAEEFSTMAYLDFIRDFVDRLGWSEYVLREALGDDDGEPDTSAATWNQDLLSHSDFQGHLALRAITEADVARFYGSLGKQAQVVLDRIETVMR